MRLASALVLAFALPCAAQTYTCTKSGDFTLNCAPAATPTAPPVVTQPPVVTPPVTPPVTPANVVIVLLKPSGQGNKIDMVDGVIYASPLPVASGFFDMTTDPQTPGGVQIQVSVSKTPGDMGYYKTPASCYVLFGAQQCPCGGTYIPNSAGVKWSPSIVAFDAYCIVPSGEKWYVNYQMTGASGPMIYFWRQR